MAMPLRLRMRKYSDLDKISNFEKLNALDGGLISAQIYPPARNYKYPRADLEEFCEKALNKYEEKEWKKYIFVQLEEAFVHINFKYHTIITNFKACQIDGTNMTTFRAETDSPSRTLSAPDLNISIKVVPSHSPSGSDISPASESDQLAEKLRTQTELLQII